MPFDTLCSLYARFRMFAVQRTVAQDTNISAVHHVCRVQSLGGNQVATVKMWSMNVRRLCAPFLSPHHKAGYGLRVRRIASKSRNITTACRFWPQADQDSYSAPTDIARLWVHECERVFRDRIISAPEMEVLDGMMAETAKKNLAELQVCTKL